MMLPEINDMFAYTSDELFIGYSDGYSYLTPHWNSAFKTTGLNGLIDYVGNDIGKYSNTNLVRISHTITVVNQEYINHIKREHALAKLTEEDKQILGLK